MKPAVNIETDTLSRWSAPYRNWHYYPEYVIPQKPQVPGHEEFHNTDCPTIFQMREHPGKWFMSYIGFNGQGYNSFVAESSDLLHWTNHRLLMGFGEKGEFDHGGRVLGAYLYRSYDVRAPRMLKRYRGLYWSLYGAYPLQGGYELRPGSEGVACSEDGLIWKRAKPGTILAVSDKDCGEWEKDCIYQPWLVEYRGRFFNFYNAANGSEEQTGIATSSDLINWKRNPANPVVKVRPGGYDEGFASDPKVFRDGDHWTMIYFGVGKGGAHIMIAFSRDLISWTADPEPLYKAGGSPYGLDKQFAHKISLVYHPKTKVGYLYYCADNSAGRGIALLTSARI